MINPEKVIQDYSQICNNCLNIRNNLSENAVLEWFGRTIKGRHKISNFYKYDLCLQYTHSFSTTASCDPIEKRQSHLQTRCVKEYETIEPKIPGDSSYTTPVQEFFSPKLPPVDRGIMFLSEEDNESELQSMGLSALRDSITPPPINNDDKINIAPAHKKMKFSDIDDKNLNLFSTFSMEKNRSISIDIEENDASLPTIPSISSNYSDIMYLEAVGHLRTNHSNGRITSPLSSNSFMSDRDVVLKMSYRLRLDNSEIEFSLIIYEHLISRPTIKRNLLSEFQQTFDNKLPKSASKEPDSQEIRRKKSLKQLRF